MQTILGDRWDRKHSGVLEIDDAHATGPIGVTGRSSHGAWTTGVGTTGAHTPAVTGAHAVGAASAHAGATGKAYGRENRVRISGKPFCAQREAALIWQEEHH